MPSLTPSNAMGYAMAYRRGSLPSIASADDNDAASMSPKVVFPRSRIEVHLDNHFTSKVYNIGSDVTGHITIVTQRDVPFDSIQIILLGHTTTRQEGVHAPSKSTHVFLKLNMPISTSEYPVPRVLDIGRPYKFPFHFVIPQSLTLSACHHTGSELVQEQHLRLPPTMGYWSKDDMSPDMAKVQYTVTARVFQRSPSSGKLTKVVEGAEQIRVLPSYMEDAPLNITKKDIHYTMSKTKKVKKSLLKGKLGTLTASASQPEAVSVTSDGWGISSTMAQVQLRFDPYPAESPPPKITNISSKIVAQTFFSSGPISSFPNLGNWTSAFGVERRGDYSTTVSVSSSNLEKEKVNWIPQSRYMRRDSGYGSETRQSGSDSEHRTSQANRKLGGESPIYYTATLNVPIQLPVAKRVFIPTFHSCIASRTYKLQLAVSTGGNSLTSTFNLAVPLQIVADPAPGCSGSDAGLPTFEEAEADEHMRPRILSVPDSEYRETSMLPGY